MTDTMARKARAGARLRRPVLRVRQRRHHRADGKRSHVERRINEDEAAIVRQIFAWSANGDGFTRIAKRLNAEHAPRPRPMGGRPAGWTATSVRAILLRPMYHGEPVYNTTRKRDQWGQQKTSDRPESEWIRTSAPALADRVGGRLARGARAPDRRPGAVRHLRPSARPRHREQVSAQRIRAVRGVRRQPLRPPQIARRRPVGVWLRVLPPARHDGLRERVCGCRSRWSIEAVLGKLGARRVAARGR